MTVETRLRAPGRIPDFGHRAGFRNRSSWSKTPEAGRWRCPGLQDESFCQRVVSQTVAGSVGLNVLVNKAVFQMTTSHGIEDLTNEQFDRSFKTNV